MTSVNQQRRELDEKLQKHHVPEPGSTFTPPHPQSVLSSYTRIFLSASDTALASASCPPSLRNLCLGTCISNKGITAQRPTMRTFAILSALAATAFASPMPQGVTGSIAPSSSPPAGCVTSYSGTFEITVVNVSSTSKRDLVEVRPVVMGRYCPFTDCISAKKLAF